MSRQVEDDHQRRGVGAAVARAVSEHRHPRASSREAGAQMPRLHVVGEPGRQLEHPATQSTVLKLALLRGLEALEAEYE